MITHTTDLERAQAAEIERLTRERPILFQGDMVRAILSGSKTQTRRIVKPQPDTRPGMECTRLIFKDRKGNLLLDEALEAADPLYRMFCPYGKPGDRLWVREAWTTHAFLDAVAPRDLTTISIHYLADGGDVQTGKHRPSIHMPRRISRITLEITDVRVERLQDISEGDAQAEGTPCYVCGGPMDGRSEDDCHCFHSKAKASDYRNLWERINGPGSWDVNPWVWVVEFRRIAP